MANVFTRFWDSIWGSSAISESGVTQSPIIEDKHERRGLEFPSPMSFVMLSSSISNGTPINQDTVFSVTPAWAAIRYISEGVAMMDRKISGIVGGKIRPITNHSLSVFFRTTPHPHYTWFDFLSALVANACLGNGYARIHRDPYTMRPVALEHIPPEMVLVDQTFDGELEYTIMGSIGDRQVSEVIPHTEMIHIRGLTTNVYGGKQVVVQHKSTFSAAISSKSYTEATFRNQARPSIAVRVNEPLHPDDITTIENRIMAKHSGALSAGRPLVLDNGSEIQYLQWSPQEVMLVDFEKMNAEDCSRIFKIPMDKLGTSFETGTLAAARQRDRSFSRDTLGPWMEKIQEEFSSKLFLTREAEDGSAFFEFDTAPYFEMDHQERAEYLKTLVMSSQMTPNEARERLGLEPMPHGDTLYGDINMLPLDSLVEVALAKYLSKQGEKARNEQNAAQAEQKTDTSHEPNSQ